DDAKGIDQSSVCEAGYSVSNTISTKMKNSNDTPVSNISDNTSNSDIASERIENKSTTHPILIHTGKRTLLSSEEKEMNEFLELENKKTVNNMIRERNSEKKFQVQDLSPNNTFSKTSDQISVSKNSKKSSDKISVTKNHKKSFDKISVTKNHEKSSAEISDISSDKISEQNTKLIDFLDKPLTNLVVKQEL
ncbi:106_t:CDS:2, partial [Diversispora eburnea]